MNGPAEPHRLRRVAESFGADVARYDRTRPPYPDALVDRILAGSPGTDVLDVGCGTGIVARRFREHGCRVLGVEPDVRMAAFARGGGIDVEVATFEAWDPAGRSVDAVVAGTAWHWIDPVAGATRAAAVLRSGGLLAPFHHVAQAPREVTGALAAAHRRVAPDSPIDLGAQATRPALDLYEPLFAATADGIRSTGCFDAPDRWRFDWTRTYTRDEWLDQIPTFGPLTGLPDGDLATVLDAVGAAIDATGGTVVVEYATVAVTAVRRPRT